MSYTNDATDCGEGRRVDRRLFARGISTLSIWAGLRSYMGFSAIAAPEVAGAGRLLVDPHCHAFNGRDVPIFGFLQKVIIEQELANDPLLQGLAEAYAFFLATYIVNSAPNYATEREMLRKLMKNPAAVSELKRNPGNSVGDQEFFASGLSSFIAQHTSFEGTQGLTQQNDELIIRLLRRYGPRDLQSKTNADIRAILSNPKTREQAVDTTVRTILQNRVKSKTDLTDIKKIDAYIAQFFAWVREWTQYRFQIVEDLAAISGDGSTKLRVLAPALVDIEFWLRWPGESASTRPREQAYLLYLMSLIKLPGQRILPGFIGFDPWRAGPAEET
jgi:hypothetical protein